MEFPPASNRFLSSYVLTHEHRKSIRPHNRLSLFRNWISFIGIVVAIGALFSFLLLFVLDAIAKFSNPYVSILTYMGVPAFLIGGIVLAFFGALAGTPPPRARRRADVVAD